MKGIKGLIALVSVVLVISIGLNVKWMSEAATNKQTTTQITRQDKQEKQSDKDKTTSESETSGVENQKQESNSSESEDTQRSSVKASSANEVSKKKQTDSQITAEQQYREIVVPAMKEYFTYHPDTPQSYGNLDTRMRPYLSDKAFQKEFGHFTTRGGLLFQESEPKTMTVYCGEAKHQQVMGFVVIKLISGQEDVKSNVTHVEQVGVDLRTKKITTLEQVGYQEDYD
ncbi:MAG: hypothetical protein Q4A55_03120 [Aerococcus sp.]|nr:hypothetical protein [Aerococcus sp.]